MLSKSVRSVRSVRKWKAKGRRFNVRAEEHTFEESICRSLIDKQIHKPFFYYCKEDIEIEFLYLKSIEDHTTQRSTKT